MFSCFFEFFPLFVFHISFFVRGAISFSSASFLFPFSFSVLLPTAKKGQNQTNSGLLLSFQNVSLLPFSSFFARISTFLFIFPFVFSLCALAHVFPFSFLRIFGYLFIVLFIFLFFASLSILLFIFIFLFLSFFLILVFMFFILLMFLLFALLFICNAQGLF